MHVPEALNVMISDRFKVDRTGNLTIQSLTLSLTENAENCRQSVIMVYHNIGEGNSVLGDNSTLPFEYQSID